MNLEASAVRRRRMGRAAGLVGAVAGALIVLAAALSQTAIFRDWLRVRLLASLNGAVAAKITLGGLGGNLLTSISLTNLRVDLDGKRVLAARRVAVRYDLSALLRGRLRLRASQVEGLALMLAEDERGWNLERLVERGREDGEERRGWGLEIALDSVGIRDAALKVVSSAGIWKARDLALTGSALLGSDKSVTLEKASFVLADRAVRVEEIAGRLEIGADGSVNVEGFQLRTPESQVSAQARVGAGPGADCDIVVEVARLSAAETGRVLAGAVPAVDLSGRFEVRGPASARKIAVAVRSDAGEVEIDGEVDLSATTPIYDLRAALEHVNVAALLGRRQPETDLGGTLSIKGKGKTPQDLAGAFALELLDSTVAGTALARLAVDGKIAKRSIEIEAAARTGVGNAKATGLLSLATQRYRLLLTAEEFDPTPFMGRPNIGARLNGTLTVAGTGFVPATASGEANLLLTPGRLGAVQIRAGRIDVHAQAGQLTIERIALESDVARVEASGRLVLAQKKGEARAAAAPTGFSGHAASAERSPTAGATGTALYSIRAADLRALAAIAGIDSVSGAMEINGSASGRVGALDLEATVNARELSRKGTRIENLEATVRARSLGSATASVEVSAHADDLHALARPFAELDVEGQWRRAGAQPADASISLRVKEDPTHRHLLAATAALGSEESRVEVSSLSLDLGDDTWKAEGRPTIVRRGRSLEIAGLSLLSNRGRLRVQGRAGGSGAQDLALALEGLDLEVLAPVLGEPIAGRLSASAHLGGTAVAPRVEAEGLVDEPTLGGARYQRARAEMRADGGSASLSVQMTQEESRTLALDAALPLRFSLAPLSLEAGPEFSGSLRARRIDLAFLDPFVAEFSRLSGTLDAEIAFGGSVDEPEFAGTLAVTDARAHVVPLGLTYDPIEIRARVDRQLITLETVRIFSGSGALSGAGAVQVAGGGATLASRFELTAFPLFATEFGRARASGAIDVSGTTTAPVVEGSLQCDRLVLQIPETMPGSVPGLDPTITVIGPGAPALPPRAAESSVEAADTTASGMAAQGKTDAGAPAAVAEPASQTARSAPPVGAAKTAPTVEPASNGGGAAMPARKPTPAFAGLYDRATIAIQVEVPRDAWLRRSDANIELRGWTAARKQAGAELQVTGEINAVRGWYTFQGKKFAISEGQLTFSGQELDPLLRLVAVHKAGEYTVRAIVSGTMTKPSLTLESDPQLEQADILAVLLFGKPARDLDQGESQGLREQALAVAGSYVASELRQQVSDTLGLDNLEFDTGAQGLEDSRISVGKYVSEDVFVSLAHRFGTQSADEVRVEYAITPQWSIETSSDTLGDSGIDVFWKRRY